MKLLGGKQYGEGRLPGGKVWMSMTLSLSLQLLPKAAPVNKNVFLVNMPCLLKGLPLKRATQSGKESNEVKKRQQNKSLKAWGNGERNK